jgi:hypothetical protein
MAKTAPRRARGLAHRLGLEGPGATVWPARSTVAGILASRRTVQAMAIRTAITETAQPMTRLDGAT